MERHHHLEKEGSLRGSKETGETFGKGGGTGDGEMSSSAPRTAHRRARKEERSAHLDAELRTSRAFLNQRSLHARVLTLSSCRWRRGCCRSSLFSPHTLESLNKEGGGRENCCREKVRCACEHRPARSSARSLHHLVTGERERRERRGGRECGRERQRESEHPRLLFVSPKQRREADGRKEGPALPPPPCCLPAPLAFCCVLTGREDAPAPSCPGIGVVFAGRFVDLQPCPRCARSFANNP